MPLDSNEMIKMLDWLHVDMLSDYEIAYCYQMLFKDATDEKKIAFEILCNKLVGQPFNILCELTLMKSFSEDEFDDANFLESILERMRDDKNIVININLLNRISLHQNTFIAEYAKHLLENS